MFKWTVERVITALAAGIPEVTSAYNEAYAFATTQLGPEGGAAHAYALRSVQRMLTVQENALFEKNVETMLGTLTLADGQPAFA